MAISSYPFPDQDTTEDQFTTLFKEYQESGVANGHGGTDFVVSGDSTGMQVKVQPGFAIVRGFAIQSTAVETLAIGASTTGGRVDRVVLRLDPTANSVTLAVLQGTPGAAAPALTRTATGIYEVNLAYVQVSPGVTTITASNITPARYYLGSRTGVWTEFGARPSPPRVGQIGLDLWTNAWTYWNGSSWASIVHDGSISTAKLTSDVFSTVIYRGTAAAPSGTFVGATQINSCDVPARAYESLHQVTAGIYVNSSTDTYDGYLRKDGTNGPRVRINPQGQESGTVARSYLVPAGVAVTYTTTLTRVLGNGSGSTSSDASINWIEAVVTRGNG